MDLIARVRECFKPRECLTCAALREQIASLKEERGYLQKLVDREQDALLKAVRLTPIVDDIKVRQPSEPVANKGESWNVVRKRLEEKHKRKPEDAVQDYWRKKSVDLEAEVNAIQRNEVVVDDGPYQQDIKDLNAS
jgi:hypothetical protein